MAIIQDQLSGIKDLIETELTGRREIFTDIVPDSKENVKKILESAIATHEVNAAECQTLIAYYQGIHKNILERPEQYASGVNNKIILNYAQSIVRDIVGYTFGKDIEYVPKDVKNSEKITKLVAQMQDIDVPLEDISAATYASICGVAYECTVAETDASGKIVGIKVGHLSPLTTFVVKSHAFKNPVVMSVTYYESDTEGRVYTIYTDTKWYKATNGKDGELVVEDKGFHSFGGNPISLIENNVFRIGDFEVALSILDAIDKVNSDRVNDIENYVQSLLVFINASLGDSKEEREETREAIKKNRIVELNAPSGNGMVVDAKYITQQLNPQSTQAISDDLEESLWKIVGIPDRKTRSSGGGDTGDAVQLRDGWADLEVVARNKEKYFKKAKREQLVIALNILKMISEDYDNLNAIDIDIKFSRNKRDNLATKSQAYSVLMSTETLAPEDALEIADMTTNVNEVVARGKTYWDSIDAELKKQVVTREDNIDGNKGTNTIQEN